MASVILKSVGAAAGNFVLPGIGGVLGASLAGNLGGSIDRQLGLSASVTGPRLENLAVQDSRYGAGIPTVYGNARVAGNVIWSTDLIETQHKDSLSGKGGSTSSVSTTTFTYSLHCAVGICAGPIAGINTIWADATVIYQDGVWASGYCDAATIYTGDAAQKPDSFMQSILGSDAVPAYRGLAYIVFDNLQLASFGSRLPNLTFEIAASTTTTAPAWTGEADTGLAQRAPAVQSASMPPLILQGSRTHVQSVLIGGFKQNGATAQMAIAAYDVTQSAPQVLYTVASAAFSCSNPAVDSAWAMDPAGRFVAVYVQSASAPTHQFALYDTQTKSFGAVLGLSLSGTSSVYKHLAWLDSQHVVIDDISGGVRGLRVLARAGSGLIDLGFTPLWGSGSATTSSPFYGVQFSAYADGLMAYNALAAGTNVITLRARSVVWRNNALTLGSVVTVAANLDLGSGSGMHAQLVQTASNEWTCVYGTVGYYKLMSFEPSASAFALTRPWQTITPGFGLGTTHAPMFYGDRLVLVQSSVNSSALLISEIRLDEGAFTLTVDGISASGGFCLTAYFNALRLDSARFLFMGMDGPAYDIAQLAIIERNADGTLSAIVNDILTRAGYGADDIDITALQTTSVQGYVLQEPMSARAALEPLQTFAPFDLIESDGKMKAVMRGGAAAALVSSEAWRARRDDQDPPPSLLIQRAQEADLPREVVIDVIDPSRNYEVTSQRARRLAGAARQTQKLALPVVCGADTAKRIAQTRLYTAWAERELVRLHVARDWMALDPADVIDLGNGDLLRIASVIQSGGLLQIEGFYSHAASLSSAASADSGADISTGASMPVPSVLYLLDLPLLQNADDQPGVYVATTGRAGWKSASVMRSADGISYAPLTTRDNAASAGSAVTALAVGSALYMDNANTVSVQMIDGDLSSCSTADLMNGANAAVLGGEIIQFQTATLTAPGCYTLSHLLRGRRGTESAIASHNVGEVFVLLQSATMAFVPDTLSNRNRSFAFRALSPGQSLGDAQDYTFTYGSATLCPLSPVNVKGMRAAGTGSDMTLSWTRRARLNAQWVDYIDVPLDEPQELYEADIMNGSVVMRAFTNLTSASVIYTAAQQTADWGSSVPARFTVKIYQISARYGNGAAATAVV